MTDDVGVLMVTENKSNTDTTWICIGIKVWDVGDSSGVGESDPDWGRRVIEMGCGGELLCLL
jgi:hypothetical protein